MSYTNETTYYGLPLPTGSDKSTFTDNNTAFQAVDAALHTAAEGAAQAALDITSLTGRVGDAETNITNLTTDLGLEKAKIVNLQNKETLQDGEIADVRKDAEDMICAYNEATATSTHAYSAGDYFIYNDVLYVATDTIGVGDTIVPDTNCATTNVVTQLAANAGAVGDISSLTTTDKSSAVAAINEVNTALAGKASQSDVNQLKGTTFDNSIALVQGNRYDVAHDGYLIVNSSTSADTGTIRINIDDPTHDHNLASICMRDRALASPEYVSLYVKKGLSIYADVIGGNSGAYFRSLKA